MDLDKMMAQEQRPREEGQANKGDSVADMRKTILFMQEEINRLKAPPYISATILDVGEKTMRLSMDNSGIIEIPSGAGMKEMVGRGRRVVLNPETKSIVGDSEFEPVGGRVVMVDEVLGEDKLRVQGRGESYTILNSIGDVKPGDEVMLDPSGVIALESFSKKKTKYSLDKVPVAPWTNIGGLEETIAKIKQEIEDPIIHKEIFAKYDKAPAKGILLYGPPGCGKTLLAKSIAYSIAQANGDGDTKKANGRFIGIKGPEILDKWVGNAEASVRGIYGAAREAASEEGSAIIFIDEADALLRARGSSISSDVYDSIVPQFLVEMDGLNGNENVTTVLATNREDSIDPAVLRDGRVDLRIKVPRPDQRGASEIFQIYLANKPLQPGIFGLERDDIGGVAENLAEKIYGNGNIAYNVVHPTQGTLGHFDYRHLMSGAMIEGIINGASAYAIQREIGGGKSGISQRDLEASVRDQVLGHSGFAQVLVKEDWEDVFGENGKSYQQACAQGALRLNNLMKNSAQSLTKLREVK